MYVVVTKVRTFDDDVVCYGKCIRFLLISHQTLRQIENVVSCERKFY